MGPFAIDRLPPKAQSLLKSPGTLPQGIATAVAIYAWALASPRQEHCSDDDQQKFKGQKGALKVPELGSKKNKDCFYIYHPLLSKKLNDLKLLKVLDSAGQ